jgi:uncharacterized membrane protein
MISHVDEYPMTTVAGLEANTLCDGLFHAGTWVVTVVGLFLLWTALRQPNGRWSSKTFVGFLMMGWGIFNVVEGIVDHHLLQLHHVREHSDHRLWWDLAFLAWGASMIAGGWYLSSAVRDDPIRDEATASSG